MDVLEAMKKEMLRRKLSHRTITSYLFYVRKFFVFCKKDPKKFSKIDIRDFLDKYVERESAGSSINVVHNALRFMMEEVLRKSMKLNIRYSKTPKHLPVCLNKDEVKRLIGVIGNDKHRLLVSLMYGAGLRVSEVVRLKPADIDLDAGVGWVRHGKGDKDRPFILPECLKEELKNVLDDHKVYLFLGNNRAHLSSRSVQEIVKQAAKKAGITKKVHPHTLRHSFATHLLESGVDVIAVQALLGHNEVRTTMVYLHAAKPKLLSIRSPLDPL
ncbi:tyrosine-type recombinase/integrase [Candidatus Woesearchaeota archaeon]|nr:tyrosine-type recombinase/integrase [Candidatus Woesearchaeota archaeon]